VLPDPDRQVVQASKGSRRERHEAPLRPSRIRGQGADVAYIRRDLTVAGALRQDRGVPGLLPASSSRRKGGPNRLLALPMIAQMTRGLDPGVERFGPRPSPDGELLAFLQIQRTDPSSGELASDDLVLRRLAHCFIGSPASGGATGNRLAAHESRVLRLCTCVRH